MDIDINNVTAAQVAKLMSAIAEGFPADKLHLYGTIDSRPNKRIDRNSWWLSEWPRKRVLDEVRRIGEYAEKGDLSLE